MSAHGRTQFPSIEMTKADFSASKGRRFAFTVAAAFAVLGAISYWRGRRIPPAILIGIAVVLALAGLIAPASLGPVERAWMKLAHAISRVTTPIFMGIVYFVLLTPIGFLRRVFGRNPMVHRLEGDGYWITRTPSDAERARRRMERQF